MATVTFAGWRSHSARAYRCNQRDIALAIGRPQNPYRHPGTSINSANAYPLCWPNRLRLSAQGKDVPRLWNERRASGGASPPQNAEHDAVGTDHAFGLISSRVAQRADR